MDLQQEFDAAVSRSKNLNKRPNNETLLQLYALYKQATEGDVTGDRPGGFDFKAIAKYDAWEEVRGKTRDEAKKAYIAFIDRLEMQ